jgi:hypothetical protein
MDFEENINKGLFQGAGEKTFIDKVLAKDNIQAVRDIINKDNFTRKDFKDILYLMSSEEAKLLNYSAYERYILMLFYVWIRDFVKLNEWLFDYRDFLEREEKEHKTKISIRSKAILDSNFLHIEHDIKFLVDLYFQISRTTLSIGASGFREILINKYEINYPQSSPNQLEAKQGGGLFGLGKKGG